MKITNYKRGYFDKFNCVIHGTITMNKMEFAQVVYYLNIPTVKWDYKFTLKEDLKRIIDCKKYFLINVRVGATEKIVKHFKLDNYKRGNYMLKIIK